MTICETHVLAILLSVGTCCECLQTCKLLNLCELCVNFWVYAFQCQSVHNIMEADEKNGSATKLEGKYTAVAVSFILGTGCLLPWNSILTLEDYFASIFSHDHASRIFTLTFQLSSLGTTFILAFCESRINTKRWNLAGYVLYFISTLLILVLDLATSGKGGLGVFIGVSVTGAAFGVATAIAQGGVLGELSYMEPGFVQSFLGGVAASGALTSALRIFTKAALERSKQDLRRGAILFFSIASLFELVCVVLYAFTFPKLPIVKHYRSKLVSEGSKAVSAEENPKQMEKLRIKELVSQNKDYVLGMILIYLVTLFIFPGFLSEDTGSHSLGTWYPVVVVATFNVGDLVGRYIPIINSTKLESRKGLMILILSRFFLVPAFYFAGGGQGWIVMLTCFLGMSCGYLTVCAFTSVPKGYKGIDQKAIGSLLVFCLRGGICAGLLLDWLWLIGRGW